MWWTSETEKELIKNILNRFSLYQELFIVLLMFFYVFDSTSSNGSMHFAHEIFSLFSITCTLGPAIALYYFSHEAVQRSAS